MSIDRGRTSALRQEGCVNRSAPPRAFALCQEGYVWGSFRSTHFAAHIRWIDMALLAEGGRARRAGL